MNGRMTHTYNLGKVDFYGHGRRINAVRLEVGCYIRGEGEYYEFTASAGVENGRGTDYVMCGQCLDELAEFPAIRNNPIFKKVYPIWKQYHLQRIEGAILEETINLANGITNKHAAA